MCNVNVTRHCLCEPSRKGYSRSSFLLKQKSRGIIRCRYNHCGYWTDPQLDSLSDDWTTAGQLDLPAWQQVCDVLTFAFTLFVRGENILHDVLYSKPIASGD